MRPGRIPKESAKNLVCLLGSKININMQNPRSISEHLRFPGQKYVLNWNNASRIEDLVQPTETVKPVLVGIARCALTSADVL